MVVYPCGVFRGEQVAKREASRLANRVGDVLSGSVTFCPRYAERSARGSSERNARARASGGGPPRAMNEEAKASASGGGVGDVLS